MPGLPGGATSTSVVISRGAVDTNYSLSDALGLTETELEDVTGIEVIHTGRIDSNAITTVVLDTRLREVVRGTATLVTGGTAVEPKTIAPNELRGKYIDGGETRKLVPGDVVIIPNNVPHWFKDVSSPFNYYVVKVQ